MPQPVNIRLITKEQVEQLVTPVEVVDAVVECFRALGEGKIVERIFIDRVFRQQAVGQRGAPQRIRY